MGVDLFGEPVPIISDLPEKYLSFVASSHNETLLEVGYAARGVIRNNLRVGERPILLHSFFFLKIDQSQLIDPLTNQ